MKRLLMLLSALLAFQGCDSPFEENNNTDIPVDSVVIDSSDFDITEYPSLSDIKLDSSLVISGTYSPIKGQWENKRISEAAGEASDCDYLIFTTQEILETALAFAMYRKQNSVDVVADPKVVVIEHFLRNGYGDKRGSIEEFISNLKSSKDSAFFHVVFIARPHEFGGIPLPYGDGTISGFSDLAFFEEWESKPALGRIPVANNNEGVKYLAKVIEAENNLQRDAYILADDMWGDDSYQNIRFDEMSLKIAESLNETGWNSQAFLIETMGHDTTFDSMTVKAPLSESERTQVRDSLTNGLNRLSGIFHYNGYFGDSIWTDEEIITDEIITQLETNSIYFTTARAYNMLEGERTLSEKLLLAEYGAVAMVGVSHGMTYAASHDMFIRACFEGVDSSKTIGEMYTRASLKREMKHYTIMGDPALNITGLHQ